MDSEDSRGASSDNESERKGPQSPGSSRSQSRNSQVSRSASPESPRSPTAGSPRSRTSSPNDSRSGSRSRSRSPASTHNSPRSPPRSPVNGDGPRSPSPANSSRSCSPVRPKSPTDDKNSVKSSSSRSSNKSVSPDRITDISDRSASIGSSRHAKRSDNEDGNTSDSSVASVDSSSRKNKNITKNVDTQPEEISDGDMESEHEKEPEDIPQKEKVRREININHEDLSDVSDLDESIGGHSDDELQEKGAMKQIDDTKKDEPLNPEKMNRAEDGEEQLDFEAEDGECDLDEKKDKEEKDSGSIAEDGEALDQKEKEREELEEGEVTDEDEVRPEETEPRPVCRFFSRGQCTWGASCRFLHPGVTDKGNYTMFEMIRPVVPGEYGREERSYTRPEPAPIESAWERGLRTAKEMLRKSIKRKEQDIDFEEKKTNLSLAQEEFDKENGYYGRVTSPEPRYVRHIPVDYPPVVRPPPVTEEYYGRRQVVYEPDFVPPPRERVRTYRELPSHRMPDYYNNKYEEEATTAAAPKIRKPKREVIVQRAPEEARPVRGDEWSDPWMRSKSPAGRKGTAGRKRSYSSGSSYSSSSSSRSSSESSRSSFRSRSRSHTKRASRTRRSRHVSPSVIVSERKAANERAALMNPPAPRKRAPSPGMMRVSATNPPAPTKEDQFGRTRSKMAIAAALARVKGRRRSSKSSSDSSGSSSSDSDSSGSSSSSSREESSPRRPTGVDISIAKAMDALKGSSSEKRQIKLNLKNPVGARKPEISDIARKTEALQGKKRMANSPPPLDPKSKKATSRREELLKQLKAVEDAIAKKRSKVN